YSAVTAVDAPNQHQQQNTTSSTSTTVTAYTTPLNIQTTPKTTSQAPTVTNIENINQAKTNKENAQVEEDEFINIFSTLVQEQGETSTRRQLETDGEMSKGYNQKEGTDFEESFAPVARLEAVRLFVAYAVHKLFPIYKIDIKIAFLNGPMKEEVYQALRAWYDELSNFLVSKGFSKGSIDPTLFTTKKGEDILLVQIYVDDIIFGSMNPKLSKNFEKLMHNKFEMSVIGELEFFLRIQIHQSSRGIFINQDKYAQEILIKHGMTSCDSIGTPMATKHLDADLSGTPVNQTKYHSMVRALMYLTTSRPDIVHATCYCARYQERPTEKHLKEVKRIFQYLKNTINMRLWYLKDTCFELTAFLDLDHAGCLDSRKSTYGGIQFLRGDKLVSWSSKKQD
ncbi:retrovirus-related pol polyprotein from transposon TNT 1-94, partial [Tanacetum coccineum]